MAAGVAAEGERASYLVEEIERAGLESAGGRKIGVGERVQDTFLVWDVEQRTQSDGSPFVILQLANSTGRLPTALEVVGDHRGWLLAPG